MTTILSIDPGTTESGWCLLHENTVIGIGKEANHSVQFRIKCSAADTLVVEMMQSYGKPVGREVLETCVWIGRFVESWRFPDQVKLVPRRTVKRYLCNSITANDANVRQAVIDRFPATGGGKVPQIGTRANPGPLYGASKDGWAALALAITTRDGWA